jgi:hypothetical protein
MMSGQADHLADEPPIEPVVRWQNGRRRLAADLVAGRSDGAVLIGVSAVLALAVGALAIGALAIGTLAVGRITAGRVRLKDVEIDNLVIRRSSGVA